ncbi:MAG: glycosyltransferase [Bacillaceae bacterium]|nr:glycosyltransferase [Bacillaceae bacterium]
MNKNNENQSLVSIITPAFNSARFIAEAIESVIAQTYSNWEMIIVDDCSTDQTVETVKKYVEKDSRIKLVQLANNSGPAVARNTAMKQAKGQYLAFLDSDDQWLPEKLGKQLTFMQDNDIAFSFTKYMSIDEVGEEVGSVEEIPEQTSYHQLLKGNMIGCLTVMLDVTKVGSIEMVNIRTRQDYVLWLQLAKRGFVPYGLQEVLAKYRVVENSVSSNKVKMAKQNWKVYREIEQLNLFKSSFYFAHYMYVKLKKYLIKQ